MNQQSPVGKLGIIILVIISLISLTLAIRSESLLRDKDREIDSIRGDIRSLEYDVDDLDNQISDICGLYCSPFENLSDLSSEVDALGQQIDDLERCVTDFQYAIFEYDSYFFYCD